MGELPKAVVEQGDKRGDRRPRSDSLDFLPDTRSIIYSTSTGIITCHSPILASLQPRLGQLGP